MEIIQTIKDYVYSYAINDGKYLVGDGEVQNNGGGYSFKVCDMNRLRRFIVLGSEGNTLYASSATNAIQNLQCVKNLLDQKRHQEVLDTITSYSLSGRVAKEEPILTVLAMCAGHKDLDVRKAAFTKVVEICNIPTKLFRFLELTQDQINASRKSAPPEPQKYKSNKNKRKKPVEDDLSTLSIEDEEKQNKKKEPIENTDESSENTDKPKESDLFLHPQKKKRKKKQDPEFKKVNKDDSKSSGWGRMRRKSIGAFYADDKKDAGRLLQLMTKYKSRHNWNHQQVMTYAHPKVEDDAKNLVMKYISLGFEKFQEHCEKVLGKGCVSEAVSEVYTYIKVVEEVSKLDATKEEDEARLLEILKEHGVRSASKEFTSVTTVAGDTVKANTGGKKCSFQIVREHLPTRFLNSQAVWEHLLQDMPMTALIRNLNKMTTLKLFDKSSNVDIAVNSITNVHKLKSARVHPMKILLALKTYQKGEGEKGGSLTWTPNEQILKALDDAFYLSFKQPELQEGFKTNKKYMLALDVSGSMTYGGCVGTQSITPAMAAAAMAWVTWNIEGDSDVNVVAFGSNLEDMKKYGFTRDMRINDVIKKFGLIRFGATDCSLPMVNALQSRTEVDVFIVYTDSETNCNKISPAQALRDYNVAMRRNAKLIVCGLMSNGFTVADPTDPNMIDIVGFDSNVPEFISEFAMDRLSSKCSAFCEVCR